MAESGSIDKALRLSRVWLAQDAKPLIDRCTLPPYRLQRAQELIAMARAARAQPAGA